MNKLLRKSPLKMMRWGTKRIGNQQKDTNIDMKVFMCQRQGGYSGGLAVVAANSKEVLLCSRRFRL